MFQDDIDSIAMHVPTFRKTLLPLLLLYFSILSIVATTTNEDDKTNSDDGPVPYCDKMTGHMVKCDYNTSCVYGEPNTIVCHVDDSFYCLGEHSFQVTFPCLYCWQLSDEFLNCGKNTTCRANTRYLTSCSANSTTYCLGNRQFQKYKQCNVISGYKWSMAMAFSILSGGFGVDRFYLGHWQEGVGKLFSFGGFGVWTLIDAILIAIGYLKPADSSQYE